MAAFNLTAEIQLQAPNTKAVANQIQRDLSGINVNLDVGKNAKNLAAVQQNLSGVAKQGDRASKSFNLLSRNVAEAARRFSVITVATGSFIALARGIKTSVGSAIEFQRELVKISQVTGKNLDQLKGLEQEVTRLSTSLGTANADLLQTSRVLAQAGLSALKTKQALEVLAQTTLAPTFDTIIDTTEGAIAILNQFGRQAAKTGNDIKFLEQSLDAINAVSKNFAVESSDLIATVRRTGGVFQAAGGNLKELIALFTSVRQTTREGAETIATGFRTIFTRLQRKDTIEALNELGISLQDAEGKFVGPLKAIEKLAIGLAGLDPKDVRFNEIVEQLGGFRQIGKVIPLIKQFQVTQQALAVANRSVGSTSKDAQEAQKALSVQFQKTRESFDALIRKFTDSSTFQDSAQFVLKLANTFLKFAESLETVLPLLTQFAAIKLGRSLAPGLSQLFGRGAQKRNAGGRILGFNGGGFVPGQGNGDTVPAMLTPGEFVIRKSSVNKLGAENLARINEGRQKFAGGGSVKTNVRDLQQTKALTFDSDVEVNKGKGTPFAGKKRFTTGDDLNFNRANDIAVDVNDYPERRSAAFKEYRDAVRNNDPNARGIAFEKVVTEINAGIKLATQGVAQDADSPSSRLDSVYKGIPREIKSRQKVISDKELAKKVVGASVEPISSIDKGIQANLTASQLTGSDNSVNLGSAGLIFDDTDLRRINKDVEQSEPQLGGATKSSSSQKRQRLRATKRAFGGLIQKFALGGLAKENKVGFAILDPDQGGADLDASVTRAQIRGAVKGTDAQKKALDKEISWANKKFNVARQGLPEKTSQKFYDTIAQEAANGVGVAANSLSSGLGLGSVSMPEESKQTMAAVIKKSGSQMGVLFEDVLRVMDSKGPFKPAPKGAFWDFKAGLTGGLASTYDKMPSSFVDARTSYGRSNADAAQGKIIGEIAEEYERSATYKNAKKEAKAAPASAVAAQEKRRAKQAAKMAKMRERAGFAKGGPAPSDTVPALLTPGEFVINKKAASTIGAANLNRMNKRGIAGFAKGGPVGVQKFVAGGTVERGLDALGGGDANVRSVAESLYLEALSQGATDQEGLNIAATQLNDYLTKTSSTYQEAIKANEQATAALGESTPEQTRLNAQVKARSEAEGQVRTIAARALKLQRKGIGVQKSFQDATRDVTTEQGKSLKTLEELQKSATALVVERKAAKDALKRGYSVIGGTEDPMANTRPGPDGPNGPGGGNLDGEISDAADALKEFEEQTEAANTANEKQAAQFRKFGSSLNQVTTAALAASFAAGTLIESFSGLSEEQKAFSQAFVNTISANLALAAQFGSLGLEIAASITTSSILQTASLKTATALEALAGSANKASVTNQTSSSGGAIAGKAVGVAAAGVAAAFVVDAVVKGIFEGYKAVAKIQLEAANKAADKQLEALEAGRGANEEDFVKARGAAVGQDLEIQRLDEQSSAASSAGRNAALGVAATGAAISATAGLAASAATTATALGSAAIAVNAIPVAGQVAAVALAALAVGFTVAAIASSRAAESDREQAEVNELLAKTSRDYAITQFRSIKAGQALTKSLQDASDAGASASNQINILATATQNAQNEIKSNQARLSIAAKQEAELRKKLIDQGVITKSGNVSSDADVDDDAIKDQLSTLTELTKQREQAEKASIDLIQKTAGQAATFRTLAQKAVSEGLTEIGKLGPAALSSIDGLGDLASVSPGLAKSLDIAKSKFEELKNLQLAQDLKGVTDKDVRGALVAKTNAEIAQSNLDLIKGAEEQILAQQRLAKAALLSEQAERQKALTLAKVNKNLSTFNLLLLQSDRLSAVYDAVEDAGNSAGFGAVQFDTSIFDVAFDQLNKQAIDKINSLGSGAIGSDASGFAKNISDVKQITSGLPSVFESFRRNSGDQVVDLPTLKKQLSQEIAKSIPGGLEGLGGDVRAIIEKNAEEAIGSGIKGSLSFESQEKLREELEASIQSQIAVFKRGVEIQNQFLQKLNTINSKIIAAQQTVTESVAKVSDVFERNADRLAKASGKPRSRAEREAGRTRSANLRLGGEARGAGARAGDVRATATAFKDLNSQSKKLREQQRQELRNTNPNNLADTAKKAANLGKAANAAAQGAARAKAELERLADQSARAADIEKDLGDLREKRSQIESLQESVAFASDDQRQEIFKGFRLLKQAFNQGGIQGATGDQRAAIGSALDSISNQMITFEGQQVTGKELKQIFAARETGRLGLGGLNSFVESLRAAENPLLAELKDVAKTELAASAALAGIASQELQTLKSIETTLKTEFGQELRNAQENAAEDFTPDANAAQAGIDANNDTIKNLNIRIADQTQRVADLQEESNTLQTQTLKAIQNLDTARSAAQNKSRGGPVYMNRGGVVPNSAPTPDGMEDVFKPKGTDTVPAVLEEGEFVIKKSSVDKIGKDKLQQMNNGGAVYLNGGGQPERRQDQAVARLASSGFTFQKFNSRGDEVWTNYSGSETRILKGRSTQIAQEQSRNLTNINARNPQTPLAQATGIPEADLIATDVMSTVKTGVSAASDLPGLYVQNLQERVGPFDKAQINTEGDGTLKKFAKKTVGAAVNSTLAVTGFLSPRDSNDTGRDYSEKQGKLEFANSISRDGRSVAETEDGKRGQENRDLEYERLKSNYYSRQLTDKERAAIGFKQGIFYEQKARDTYFKPQVNTSDGFNSAFSKTLESQPWVKKGRAQAGAQAGTQAQTKESPRTPTSEEINDRELTGDGRGGDRSVNRAARVNAVSDDAEYYGSAISASEAAAQGATLGQASDDAYAQAERERKQELDAVQAENEKRQKPNFSAFYSNINDEISLAQEKYIKFRKFTQDPPLTKKEATKDFVQRSAKDGLGRPFARSLAAYKKAVMAGEIKDDTALKSDFTRYGKDQPFRSNFSAQDPPQFGLTANKILELRGQQKQREEEKKIEKENKAKSEAYNNYVAGRESAGDEMFASYPEASQEIINRNKAEFEKRYQAEKAQKAAQDAANKKQQAADQRAQRVKDAGGGAVGEAIVKAQDKAKQAKKEADARKKSQEKARAEYEAYNSPEAKQARKDEIAAKAREAEEDARIKSEESKAANAQRLKDKQDADKAAKEQRDTIREAEKKAYVAAFTEGEKEGSPEYAQAAKQAEQEWLKGKRQESKERRDNGRAKAQAKAEASSPESDTNKTQKYNSILRRNGPRAAAKYAQTVGLQTGQQSGGQRGGGQRGGGQQGGGQMQIMQFLLSLLKNAGIDPRALAQGFNNGGKAVDNIPAMLTAGEYVVDEEATKKIGVKNLEKMNATGEIPQKFAKGGVVGGMKTSYLQKGGNAGGSMGPLEINTGPFGEVLDKFSAAFGSKLDNMVGQFDFIAGAVDNLATVINNGMKVSHSFSGDMKMTFSMSEEQTTNIVNAVGDAMTPKMEEIIKREVDQRFNKNSFKAGG